MIMNKNLLVLRIILSLFVLVILIVPFVWKAFYMTYLFVRYGGEFISYRKDDKDTIFKIYQHLKNNQQPKQQHYGN